jgi:hypothetical protein
VHVTAVLTSPEPAVLEGTVALLLGRAKVAELPACGRVVQQSLEVRDCKGQPLQQVSLAAADSCAHVHATCRIILVDATPPCQAE